MNEHLSPQEFQILGHQIINRLSRFLDTIESNPITPAENPEDDMHQPAPESVEQALDTIAELADKGNQVVEEMLTGTASKIAFCRRDSIRSILENNTSMSLKSDFASPALRSSRL